MTVETYLPDGGSGDTPRKTTVDTTPKPSKPSETTLLTPAQTYFADEKIQIPETDVSIGQ